MKQARENLSSAGSAQAVCVEKLRVGAGEGRVPDHSQEKMARSLAPFAVAVVVLLALASSRVRCDGGKPTVLRGIAPEDRKRYKAAFEGKHFKCFDGSGVVESSALNDDFCDCEDGSDEPGTSACAKGKFYCRNVGYRPKIVSSMFVDDGVCDCCDGTDEREGCGNTCKEEGAELRKELKGRIHGIEQGLREKFAMLAHTRIDKEETAAKAAVVRKRINATSILVDKLEEKLKAINQALLEEHEAKMAKEKAQSPEDYEEEDEDVGDEEYKAAMAEEDADGGATKKTEETDEEIRRKIASRWTKDPSAAQTEGAGEEGEGAEADGDHDGAPTKPATWDEEEDGSWEPPKAETPDVDDFDYDTFQKEAKTIETDATGGSDSNSFLSIFKKGLDIVKRVFEKSELERVQTELSKQQSALGDMKKDLQKFDDLLALDFGEDNKFVTLYGECFKKVIEKYTYEVCPFGSAKQDHTNLGKYKGLGDGEKSFIFADGTKCWNGPHRSIRVDLECGAHNEIVKVSEPSVCEYAAVMITPLVCDRAELEEAEREYKALTGEVGGHDEL